MIEENIGEQINYLPVLETENESLLFSYKAYKALLPGTQALHANLLNVHQSEQHLQILNVMHVLSIICISAMLLTNAHARTIICTNYL